MAIGRVLCPPACPLQSSPTLPLQAWWRIYISALLAPPCGCRPRAKEVLQAAQLTDDGPLRPRR
eukprot:3179088-Pyramimonas_sp.AAC.1